MDAVIILAIFALAEPILILAIAPRITKRMVKRDVDAIVEEKIQPRIMAAVGDGVKPLIDALNAAKEAAQQAQAAAVEMEGSDAARVLQTRSVESRQDRAMREEAVVAEIIKQAGPVGAILAEEAKARFRNHWNVLVRQGPAAVPGFLEQAKALMPGLNIPGIGGTGSGAGFL